MHESRLAGEAPGPTRMSPTPITRPHSRVARCCYSSVSGPSRTQGVPRIANARAFMIRPALPAHAGLADSGWACMYLVPISCSPPMWGYSSSPTASRASPLERLPLTDVVGGLPVRQFRFYRASRTGTTGRRSDGRTSTPSAATRWPNSHRTRSSSSRPSGSFASSTGCEVRGSRRGSSGAVQPTRAARLPDHAGLSSAAVAKAPTSKRSRNQPKTRRPPSHTRRWRLWPVAVPWLYWLSSSKVASASCSYFSAVSA